MLLFILENTEVIMNYRKHIRLPNYDYSQNGYYFVTVCTHMRRPIFVDAVKSLVEQKINQIPEYYPTVSIDYFLLNQEYCRTDCP